MNDITTTELQPVPSISPRASPTIQAMEPPAYQSQAGPIASSSVYDTMPSSPQIPLPVHSPNGFANHHTPGTASTTPNGIENTITVALMNQLAVKHGCCLRYSSSSTGPDHMPTWTANCISMYHFTYKQCTDYPYTSDSR